MNLEEQLAYLDMLFQSKRLDEIEHYLLDRIRQSIMVDDLSATLTWLNEIIGYYRSISHHEEALTMSRQALKLITSMNLVDTIAHATTLINIATAYRASGDYQTAKQTYQQALGILEIYAEEPLDNQFASLYNNLALTYESLGEPEAAVTQLKKALEHLRLLDHTELNQAITYTNLACAYYQLHQYDQCLKMVEEARRLYVSLEATDDNHYAALLAVHGQTLQALGHYSEAKSIYLEALQKQKQAYGRNAGYLELLHNLKADLEKLHEDIQDLDKEIAEVESQLSRHEVKKGLDLAQAYFEDFGKEMLEKEFADIQNEVAAGLVGMGSECLGMDDGISQDHDFGPGFCLFIPRRLGIENKKRLQEAYDRLPKTYLGYTRQTSAMGEGRVGVFFIEDFFKQYTGHEKGPQQAQDWFAIPEGLLLTCTNGRLFRDPSGQFSTIYQRLKKGYPKDVRLKKMAAVLAKMAQAGQYNYQRCLIRKDLEAAYLAKDEWIKQGIHLIYLLNQQYQPYYKWQIKMAEGFSKTQIILDLLKELIRTPVQELPDDPNLALIDQMASAIKGILEAEWNIKIEGNYLEDAARALEDRIEDPKIKKMHIMEGIEYD